MLATLCTIIFIIIEAQPQLSNSPKKRNLKVGTILSVFGSPAITNVILLSYADYFNISLYTAKGSQVKSGQSLHHILNTFS